MQRWKSSSSERRDGKAIRRWQKCAWRRLLPSSPNVLRRSSRQHHAYTFRSTRSKVSAAPSKQIISLPPRQSHRGTGALPRTTFRIKLHVLKAGGARVPHLLPTPLTYKLISFCLWVKLIHIKLLFEKCNFSLVFNTDINTILLISIIVFILWILLISRMTAHSTR